MRSFKLLAVAPFLLAACSAEVDENIGQSEAALKAGDAPQTTYRWEENAAIADDVDARIARGEVGVREVLEGQANMDVQERSFLRPKLVVLSGPSPLTPASDPICAACKR